MAINVTLNDIASGYNLSNINANFTAITTALQDAISRSGETPNEMDSDLDLDGQDILNIGAVTTQRLILNGVELTTQGFSKGDRGWSPVFAIVSDSARRVFQLTGYVGGGGTPPSDFVGYYVGPTSMVTDITLATDVRGPQGSTGAGTGDMLAAQNLNDVANKLTAFNTIKQAATDVYNGVVELATSVEVGVGTDNTRAISPSSFMSFYISQNLGKVFDFTGPTAPALHIFSYGQALSRTTYAAYFAQVGTTYGPGDGSTTFNGPDLRGRSVFGKDNMGGTSANRLTGQTGGFDGDVLGAVGGEERHVMSLAEMAAHAHVVTSTGGAWGANGGNPPAFRNSAGDSFTGTSRSMTSTTQGTNTPHNNLPPGIVLNKVLFVGV